MGRKQDKRKKASKPAREPAAPDAAAAPVVAAKRRRDLRPLIYMALDEILFVAFFIVLSEVIPNRMKSATIHLWTIPILVQGMAIGMGCHLHQAARVRRVGWWIAVISGSLLLLSTILVIVRVLVSAAFLAGVYGAFGKAAAMSALIGVALVVEVVALVPIFQVKYLMTRAGRRAYAMPTS
jgi:hypothetical protein